MLLQLALTANGRATSMDSAGGGHHEHQIPTLDYGDAPHLYYLADWQRAASDEDRARVLDRAEDELDRIRISRAHDGEEETLDELFDRIATVGEGWPANDVAVALRTTASIVRRARRERGRDEETGRPVEDASGVSREERRQRVRHLKQLGRNARQIARSLGIPYTTVLRDLGQKT